MYVPGRDLEQFPREVFCFLNVRSQQLKNGSLGVHASPAGSEPRKPNHL